MGSGHSKEAEVFNYESILPNTENIAKGLGGIYRTPGYEKKLIYTYDDSVQTVLDNFLYGYAQHPDGMCLGHRPIVDGEAQDYVWITYEETVSRINALARALDKHGLLSTTDGTEKRTDGTPIRTIGHFSCNCPELIISQFAVWTINGTVVPLYETLGEEAISLVANEMELETIVCNNVSGSLVLKSVVDFGDRFARLKNLILIGTVSDELKENAKKLNKTIYMFDDLVEEGRSLPEYSGCKATCDDICMVCYTSGTTAAPKGAVISHKNVLAVGTCVISYIDTIGGFTNEDVHISYLPMAHVFEHFVQMGVFHYGAQVGFSQGNTAKLVDDIKHIRPTLFPSVPRLFTRIVDTVLKQVKEKPAAVQALFYRGLEAKRYNLHHYNITTSALWDNLVFKRIQTQVGLDRVKFMVTGSAPLSAEYMDNLRILFSCKMIQGLGLTETIGGICCSFMNDNATSGHCGGVIQSGEARLISVPEKGYLVSDTYHGREVDKDGKVIKEGIACKGRGECCFRGHNIIKGYYKRPEINKEVYDEEGWFHSGDIGLWLPNGAIKIIDRKKDIFKLAQGEYISPDKVTAVYLTDPFISNIFIYGDSYQSYLVAVVVPEENELRKELKKMGMEEEKLCFQEICELPEVKKLVFLSMNSTAKDLMGFERVKNITLCSEEWSINNNMLTPTMKLKRDVSKQKYDDAIHRMYQEGILSY